jgi:hypothetical protein
MSTLSSAPVAQRFALARLEAEFLGGVACGDIGFGEMAGKRLRYTRGAAGPNGHLNGTIAVGLFRS